MRLARSPTSDAHSVPERPETFFVDEDTDLTATPFIPTNREQRVAEKLTQGMSIVSQSSSTPLTSNPVPLPPDNFHSGTRRSLSTPGMTIANPDDQPGLGADVHNPAMVGYTLIEHKRAAARAAQFNEVYPMQEFDAGPAGTIPPSYDPTWAGQMSSTASVGDPMELIESLPATPVEGAHPVEEAHSPLVGPSKKD